ncbi:MAG TPA: AbrB/MazE/SpoVT family DNA-binding domain-containing protein [Proteobacteria bacterium]|nr:AbrB/MazE/SpoVT family DNA-binding domain-containing protein [Pseudomonadota bacterium]
MIMKVFNKGQVVIPAAIRHALGIDVGDMLDVRFDAGEKAIELRKVEIYEAETLAGSLAKYGRDRAFPSRRTMNEVLRKGMGSET